MTRREFILNAFKAGGVAALVSLGLSREAIADVLVTVKKRATSSSGPSLWAAWGEASESTLSLDQNSDSTEDTNICFQENAVAGGNETSVGIVSGANLVYTQVGDVAGALGSPPSRVFDGVDNGMTMTAGWAQGCFISSAGWLWLIKLNYTGGALAGERICDIGDAGNDFIQIEMRAGDIVRFYVRKDGGNLLFADSTDALPSGSAYYVMVAGTSAACYGGFTSTRPTKWSDFAANKRVTNAIDARYGAGDFLTTSSFMYDGGGGAVPATVYYSLASTVPASFINFGA